MKFGFDLRRLHLVTAWYSGSSAADDYGDFFFNGQYSGNNFADFLLGVPYYTYVTTLHRRTSMAAPLTITVTRRTRSEPLKN